MKNIALYFRKNKASIYTGMALGGLFGTTILSGKNAISAYERTKDKDLDWKQKAVIYAEECLPTAVAMIFTSMCVVKADNTHRDIEKGLLASIALANKKIDDLEQELTTEQKNEIKSDVAIRNIPQNDNIEIAKNSKGTDLFYCEFSGRYFRATTEEVLNARYELNRQFQGWGYASLNDFYSYIAGGLKKTHIGNSNGWQVYRGEEEYGYTWIDIDIFDIADPKTGETLHIIRYLFDPHADYLW